MQLTLHCNETSGFGALNSKTLHNTGFSKRRSHLLNGDAKALRSKG